jgi:hypothetical protein
MMTVKKLIYVGPNPPAQPDEYEADYQEDAEAEIINSSAKVKKVKKPKENGNGA